MRFERTFIWVRLFLRVPFLGYGYSSETKRKKHKLCLSIFFGGGWYTPISQRELKSFHVSSRLEGWYRFFANHCARNLQPTSNQAPQGILQVFSSAGRILLV